MRGTTCRITGTCLAIVCLAAGIAALKFAVAGPQDTPSANRKVFADSVTPLPAQPGPAPHGLLVHEATNEHQDDKLELLFSVAIPAATQDKLEARVAKGEIVPPDELERDYFPKAADAQTLEKWLKDQGFEIIHTASDNTGVYARATVAQIEKSLEVQMVRVTKGGFTYNAARNAPSLPAEVGANVQAIIGLQPYRHLHRHNRRCMPNESNRASPKPGVTPESPTPAPNIANKPPYLVKEVLKAYNADNLPVNGAGQRIAVLIDTFPADDDLQEFWKRNQLTVKLNQVEKIKVKSGPLPAPEGEETLDVQWTSGIAPGATVRVYASGSLSFVDLDRALDRIFTDAKKDPAMRQLSISLGLGETFMGGPRGEVAIQHRKFLKLAALGVNVFVSSGDAGSNPDETGHGSGGPLQAEYESSDPVVIGVGGTTLILNPQTGAVTAERAWAGSGGGKSIFFARPSWQKGAGIPPGPSRLVPDVSLLADPNRGVFLFFQGEVQQIGGTSLSAPVWAGFCALMNESRSKANKRPLPFLNPLLYPLLGSECFRDITEGNNGSNNAGPGHDLVTGLGVPNVKALLDRLTAQNP
jgi:kumamolisin